MTDEKEMIDQDLHCWAAYHRAYNTTGLGYSALSITARCAEVLRLGALINGSYKPVELSIPDWMERIDYAITQIKQEYQEVIKQHYMEAGNSHKKSKRLGITRNNYYQRLNRAREAILTTLDRCNRTVV